MRAFRDAETFRAHPSWSASEAVSQLTGGDDPIGFVISLNIHRRHLSTSQKGLLAARAYDLFKAEAKERQREHGGTAPNTCAHLSTSVPGSAGKAREKADLNAEDRRLLRLEQLRDPALRQVEEFSDVAGAHAPLRQESRGLPRLRVEFSGERLHARPGLSGRRQRRSGLLRQHDALFDRRTRGASLVVPHDPKSVPKTLPSRGERLALRDDALETLRLDLRAPPSLAIEFESRRDVIYLRHGSAFLRPVRPEALLELPLDGSKRSGPDVFAAMVGDRGHASAGTRHQDVRALAAFGVDGASEPPNEGEKPPRLHEYRSTRFRETVNLSGRFPEELEARFASVADRIRAARILEAPPLASHGGDRSGEQVDGVKLNEGGNSAEYIASRLRRDGHDDLVEAMASGAMSASEARRQAGFGALP